MPLILRDQGVGAKMQRHVQVRVYKKTSTGGGAITIETHCSQVLFEVGKEIDATATLAATIGSSSTYTGTKTVAYTVGAGKTLECMVVGVTAEGYDDTATVASTATLDQTDVF